MDRTFMILLVFYVQPYSKARFTEKYEPLENQRIEIESELLQSKKRLCIETVTHRIVADRKSITIEFSFSS